MVDKSEPPLWARAFVIFPAKWVIGAVSLWVLEEVGWFTTFGIEQLGVSHLTWAQRFGIALLMVP